MERQGIALDWIAKAAIMLAMALVLPAQAQTPGSANEFQLPPGAAAPPPPAAGPVDPEKPVPVQVVPTPLPPPNAAPPPVVFPKPPGTPAAGPSSPQAAGSAPAPVAQSAPRTMPAPAPSTQAPATVPVVPPPAPSVTNRQAPSAPVPIPTAAIPAAPFLTWIWWIAGGALLVFLLTGIGLILRRRRRSDDTDISGYMEEPPPLVEDTPMANLQTDVARPPIPPSQIELVFEPQCLTMALVNARLTYRLSLTNRGDAAVGPVSIACDIISAHASLSASEQLLFGPGVNEPKHQIGSLAPGETISLTGELQLPIAAILPIRSGEASLFVPLVRFHITAGDTGRPPSVSTRIFVIGESPDQPGKRLRPIRIDQGPRTFSGISQREVETSA